MPKGLSELYKVVDRNTGEEVKGVFVLDPVNDPHSRAGLWGYARSVEDDNYMLANDLKLFITKLNEADRKAHETGHDAEMESMLGWIRGMHRGDNNSESNS